MTLRTSRPPNVPCSACSQAVRNAIAGRVLEPLELMCSRQGRRNEVEVCLENHRAVDGGDFSELAERIGDAKCALGVVANCYAKGICVAENPAATLTLPDPLLQPEWSP